MQLYKIPRDPSVARKWLDACGFQHIPVSPSTSTFKICREHFTPNDFEGPAILRPDAVPSLFTTHSRLLMDKQSPSPNKRFRSDLANIRTKAITANNNNNQRTTQMPQRNNNYYQRQQDQILLSPPVHENFDENSKQISDIDLNMNCFEEQLSDSQTAHCPVKVSLPASRKKGSSITCGELYNYGNNCLYCKISS